MRKQQNNIYGVDPSLNDTMPAIVNALFERFHSADSQPIRIAVIGEAGVGKTSTLNALFQTDMPVSHFKPCTQKAEIIRTKTKKGIPIEVIDLPGLWAGEAETKRHWETYKKVLPTVDCAIWVISAGDRALEGMQQALRNIASFSGDNFMNKIVVGVNKAEHMYPEEWNTAINQPNETQEKNLILFCDYVKTTIQEIFPHWNGEIRYYSAHKQYRLDELLEQMLITATKFSSENALKIARAADPVDATELITDRRAYNLAQDTINKKNRR